MARISILADIAGQDLEQVVKELPEFGIELIDLKRGVFGHAIESLDDTARNRLAALLEQSSVENYSFSSNVGYVNISTMTETEFRTHLNDGVSNMLKSLRVVRPTMIRLLACSFDNRAEWDNSNEFLERHAPWVYSAYDEAIARINDAGIIATIENEPNTIFSNPTETIGFFDRLARREKVGFTWDIQNMWQSGSFPTVESYRLLKPIINYVHTKGGRGSEEAPNLLTWRSSLEDASWPVREILAEVLTDNPDAVICVNTSHGKVQNATDSVDRFKLGRDEARRDITFLQQLIGDNS